jgi:membrane protease YdiL (CAAX protease family)
LLIRVPIVTMLPFVTTWGAQPGAHAPGWVWDGTQWAWHPAAWTWTGATWVSAPSAPRQGWTRALPAGEPFHRLGRTSAHRWWRPLLGTLALLVGIVVVIIPIVLGAMAIGYAITGSGLDDSTGRFFTDARAELAIQLLPLAAMTPVVLATVWLVGRRRPGSVLSVVGKLRWRWLAVCTALAFAGVLVTMGLAGLAGMATGGDGGDSSASFVGWGEFLPAVAIIVVLVPLQSAAEELVFRGWLLQAVGSWSMQRPDGSFRAEWARKIGRVLARPLLAMIVTSLLFVSVHGYSGWAMVEIFCFAMTAAYVTVKTGGLEASIAFHTFNNLLAFIASSAYGALDESLDQGGAPASSLLTSLPPMLVFIVIVLLVSRDAGIAKRSPTQ